MSQCNLRYRNLWLCVGWGLVLLVIYGSLTAKPVQLDIRYFDKFSHLISYFILMSWFAQLYSTFVHYLLWALFFVVLGIVLEYLQALGGVRYFEWADMLANTSGVLLGFMFTKTRFANSLHWLELRLGSMRHH